MSAVDINHFFGSDIALGPTGDLSLVSGALYSEQRLVRRLLTAAGDYIQQIGYGAGLGAFVGQPGKAGVIAGVIKRQCGKEVTISQNPPPTVLIQPDATGNVTATITYTSAVTGLSAVATVPLSGS
jgi:hypothetical protein